MLKFQEMLRDLIAESEFTIYSLSHTLGIERSYLSKMLSGARNMSIENFHAILGAVCKSDVKRTQMVNAYISDVFGSDKFEKYFSHMAYNSGIQPKTQTSVTEIKDDFMILNSQLDLFNFAAYLVSDKNKTGRIYTNFPVGILLDVASKKENCDFRCIVNSTSKGKAVSIFDLIKLNLLCCTSYIDDSRNYGRNRQQLYSFVIITDDVVLLAKKDFEKGYYIRNSQLADLYAEDFSLLCKSMKINSQVHDDILDVKIPISKHMFSRKLHRVIDTGICVAPFMTADEWDELARDDLPGREYLINTTKEYYREYFDSIETHIFITPINGLTDFCRTGIVRGIPVEYSKPLKVETRIAILKRIAEFAKSNPDKYKISFLKSTNFENTDFTMSIESAYDPESDLKSTLIAMASDESKKTYFPGNYLFISSDEDSIGEYNDFFDLLRVSEKAMTSDESLAALEDRILRLEYSLNEN